jgi:proline dehydrogenase
MTRQFFLYLSTQKSLRKFAETSPVSRKFNRRFVAGETLEEAIQVCRKLRADQTLVTLDHLGENVASLEEAASSRDAYLEVLQQLCAAGLLESTVSIKLTQFGLDFSNTACCENVRQLVARAKELGTRVEIDMESSEYTDRTLKIVREMHREFGCVRAVIQAYLHRSQSDIEILSKEGIPVRLCKGAYNEPEEHAIQDKAGVDANYHKLICWLLDHGVYPAIASHDEKLLKAALEYASRRGIGKDRFEVQMLYGIRRDLQRDLITRGYRLRLYVPYGTAWYPYFMRRLAERPANVFFILRNLLRS